MDARDLAEHAALLRRRNILDEQIGRFINRPMTAAHAGEWIASRIFDIELEPSAVAKAIDGRFRTGALAGRSVNVKWYLTVRPRRIDAVYLFDAQPLLTEQRGRGVKVGVASGVRQAQWPAAEVYPTARNPALALTNELRQLLAKFSR